MLGTNFETHASQDPGSVLSHRCHWGMLHPVPATQWRYNAASSGCTAGGSSKPVLGSKPVIMHYIYTISKNHLVGIYMVYTWYIHGTYMVYTWYIHGIYMVYIYIYGIHKSLTFKPLSETPLWWDEHHKTKAVIQRHIVSHPYLFSSASDCLERLERAQ